MSLLEYAFTHQRREFRGLLLVHGRPRQVTYYSEVNTDFRPPPPCKLRYKRTVIMNDEVSALNKTAVICVWSLAQCTWFKMSPLTPRSKCAPRTLLTADERVAPKGLLTSCSLMTLGIFASFTVFLIFFSKTRVAFVLPPANVQDGADCLL